MSLCHQLGLHIPKSIKYSHKDVFLVVYVHSTRCQHPLCQIRPVEQQIEPTPLLPVNKGLDVIKFYAYPNQTRWMALTSIRRHPTFACTLISFPPITELTVHIFWQRALVTISNAVGITMHDFSEDLSNALARHLTEEEVVWVCLDEEDDWKGDSSEKSMVRSCRSLWDVVEGSGKDIYRFSKRRRNGYGQGHRIVDLLMVLAPRESFELRYLDASVLL
jgi:hypothetical protein